MAVPLCSAIEVRGNFGTGTSRIIQPKTSALYGGTVSAVVFTLKPWLAFVAQCGPKIAAKN